MRKFVHEFKDVAVLVPQQIAADFGGNLPFVSLKNCNHASILIQVGANAGDLGAITLQQARNVEGRGNKSLAFSKVWEQTPDISPIDTQDRWTELDVTSDTFSITPNTRYRIEIDPASLDVDNGYDCIRVHGTSVGTFDIFMSISIQLYNLRHTGEDNLSQPSAKVN